MDLRNSSQGALSFLIAALLVGCGDSESGSGSKPPPVRSLLRGGAKAVDVPQAPAPFPELGPGQELDGGVMFHQVSHPVEGLPCRLWVYLPDPAGEDPVPCVLIAPSGTPLFHGIGLVDGDRDEHLPYAKAGMAVVAYELNGAVEDVATDRQLIDAAMRFKAADGGLKNGAFAIDYISEKIPQVDTNRLYSAGHSSAGTVSLLLAQYDARISACIAFAPGLNVERHLGEDLIWAFSQSARDYRNFARRISPALHVDRLTRPLFLFQAEDDDVVSLEEARAFAAEVGRLNSKASFTLVKSGGHYNAMIEQGIPRAIRWLKEL